MGPKIARYIYVLLVVTITGYLAIFGRAYYSLPLEERFYNDQHALLKASGFLGHGLGIVGTLMILFGVVLYMAAKKYGVFTRWVRLKYLLEFHIFLCTLGPILIVFHSTFKFGGLVSIAFWSMAIVVLSGVVGRFLYIRLPRDSQGRELSFDDATRELKRLEAIVSASVEEIKLTNTVRIQLRSLDRNQRYFKYWHIAHRPFALIMLVIVIVHIGATLLFGFQWTS